MFSTMPLPVFRDDANTTLASTFTASSPYRPAKSSPLSSSPIRPSSNSPPSSPLAPRDPNIRRESQSSPIPTPLPAFQSKFAARPSRPNPVTQKREAAQESRRKLFLKNVRQRAEDRRWEMRGGEQELLKLEWFSLNKDLQQAKNADLNGLVLDSDIEDAARLREDVMSKARALGGSHEASAPQEQGDVNMDLDELLVGMFEQEQQAELEAMAREMSGQASSSNWPPDTPQWCDDEDYDAIFMDYLNQEQEGLGHSQGEAREREMDLS
ncbi:hypothetical protein N0V82_001749 [Gnomoniopsis sp. IMI 355080]|nr:hypothetical protein N0V82_001749 [Gnomoniopsis sp. IMI 355080]